MIVENYYQQLLACAQHLPVQQVRFTLQLQQSCTLPAYTGSTLHGLLGHALQRTSPRVFNACYQQHHAQQPSPYALVPDASHKTEWLAGECYQFDIKLFGQLTEFASTFIEAMSVAQSLGLGPQRTRFTVLRAESLTPENTTMAHLLADALAQQAVTSDVSQSIVMLKTPLRIKVTNRLQRDLPNLADLTASTLHRFAGLIKYWQHDDSAVQQALKQCRPPLQGIYCVGKGAFHEWPRYSKREHNLLPFGGVLGSYLLEGELDTILPWLHIAEVIHIGGKAGFGLGQIEVF